MKMIRTAVLLLVLVSLAASSAYAQLSGPTLRADRWDISIQTRYTGAKDIDADGGSSMSLSDDLGWGFGFGYHIDDRFTVGFVSTWRSIPYDAVAVNAEDPDSVAYYSNWLDTATFALTGEWNLLPTRATPFVQGALGWTMIDTNILAGRYGGCWWDPWWGYVCSYRSATYGKTAFSYSIGGGVRLELSDTFFTRVGYDYNRVNVDNVGGLHIFRVDAGVTL